MLIGTVPFKPVSSCVPKKDNTQNAALSPQKCTPQHNLFRVINHPYYITSGIFCKGFIALLSNCSLETFLFCAILPVFDCIAYCYLYVHCLLCYSVDICKFCRPNLKYGNNRRSTTIPSVKTAVFCSFYFAMLQLVSAEGKTKNASEEMEQSKLQKR